MPFLNSMRTRVDPVLMISKKNILMGVGNVLKGDDGIGSIIAKSFTHQDWLSLDVE